jgi:hypothetical protein
MYCICNHAAGRVLLDAKYADSLVHNMTVFPSYAAAVDTSVFHSDGAVIV